MKFTIVSGTGNTFALFDGFPGDGISGELPNDPRSAAIELCAAPLAELACVRLEPNTAAALAPDARLDGILLLLPSRESADARMVIHNADGSRPETCGNGLRATAHYARAHGRVARDEFTLEADAGVRFARVLRAKQDDAHAPIVAAEVSMGEPVVVERRVTLKTPYGAVEATLVDVGNPHCVVFVRDERETPVGRLGPELERHRHFPARTNVEFAALRDGSLSMRVWERGVGETAACGSGACAAAVAAAVTQRASTPIDVRMPGGVLAIDWHGAGHEVRLSGATTIHGPAIWRSAELAGRDGAATWKSASPTR